MRFDLHFEAPKVIYIFISKVFSLADRGYPIADRGYPIIPKGD